MKSLLFFLPFALAASNTIWKTITAKSNGNSSLFYSLLNSTRFAPLVQKQLNNTNSTATLFVPLDSYFINGEQHDSSFDDDYAPIAPLNATASDWIRYQIATNSTINFSPSANGNSSQIMHTLLKNSSLVNLAGNNGTGQVVLSEQAHTGNTTLIYDGQWPPACISNYTNTSNGQIVFLDRALRIPRNLDDALSQNALFGFQRALLEQGKMQMANSTAGVTVFAPMRFGSFDQVDTASFLVNSTVYFPENGTLTSMSGAPLTITTSPQDGSIMVNGTRIVKKDILLANGVMHVLEAGKVGCGPAEEHSVAEEEE